MRFSLLNVLVISVLLISCIVARGCALDSFLNWDNAVQTVTVINDTNAAHLTFNCANISSGDVTITNVQPSCGCTTAKLPPLPWTIAPGANGRIDITVNIANDSGTISKTVLIETDRGSNVLEARITISVLKNPVRSGDQRMQDIKIATIDRQAIFKADCATCHVKPAEGKYGRELYQRACGICHDAPDRAANVPDLHSISESTDQELWRKWAAYGKPHSLMPAFAATEGGPLTDMQILTLAAYLNAAIPSHQ